MRLQTAVVSILAVLSSQATAQQPATPPTPIVVRAARMLDVASGRVLRDARVVVTGELITAVNPATPPAGARAR